MRTVQREVCKSHFLVLAGESGRSGQQTGSPGQVWVPGTWSRSGAQDSSKKCLRTTFLHPAQSHSGSQPLLIFWVIRSSFVQDSFIVSLFKYGKATEDLSTEGKGGKSRRFC